MDLGNLQFCICSRGYLDSFFDLLIYFQGYILVYDVTNESSFQCMDRLKKFIEKNKEKKEVNSLHIFYKVIILNSEKQRKLLSYCSHCNCPSIQ